MSQDKTSKEANKDAAVDQDMINDLAHLLKTNDLSEIEIEHHGLRVRIARQMQMSTHSIAAAPAPAQPAPAAAPAPATEAPAADIASHPGTLKSPMVGTVYLSPEPGVAPYVSEGTKVTEGQTVMIVEAMKTMNYIPAHRSGTVKSILVANEQPVEYNEPLLVIE